MDQALGVELPNLDLKTIGDAEFAAIHQSWLDHLVILVRDQHLTDDDLIAFSRRFGDLDWAPVQETGRRFVAGHPEIYVVSNVVENGVPIGSLGAGEAVWHTDMSYLEDPPKASMLYALEIPPEGGNTYFCNMYCAYELLPDDLKRRISGLQLKHDGTYNSGGYVRQGVTAVDDPMTSPGVYHPLVCTHPETGRRMLYLGRRRNAYIGGLSLSESESLLDELWSIVPQPGPAAAAGGRVPDPRANPHAKPGRVPEAAPAGLLSAHQWRVGDVVLWDNRCTMHRRDPFDADSRRILHRTQIKGDSRPRP